MLGIEPTHTMLMRTCDLPSKLVSYSAWVIYRYVFFRREFVNAFGVGHDLYVIVS